MNINQRIGELISSAQAREKEEREVLEQLRSFTLSLYPELEKVLRSINDYGLNYGGKLQRKEMSHDLQMCSFDWNERIFTIVPIQRAALPNQDVANSIPGLPNKLLGRVVVFHDHPENKNEGTALEDIYVSADGVWYATGSVGPCIYDSYNSATLQSFAFALIEHFTLGLTPYHRSIDEMPFSLSKGSDSNLGFTTLAKRKDAQ